LGDEGASGVAAWWVGALAVGALVVGWLIGLWPPLHEVHDNLTCPTLKEEL
jgi:hypothetical protein